MWLFCKKSCGNIIRRVLNRKPQPCRKECRAGMRERIGRVRREWKGLPSKAQRLHLLFATFCLRINSQAQSGKSLKAAARQSGDQVALADLRFEPAISIAGGEGNMPPAKFRLGECSGNGRAVASESPLFHPKSSQVRLGGRGVSQRGAGRGAAGISPGSASPSRRQDAPHILASSSCACGANRLLG